MDIFEGGFAHKALSNASLVGNYEYSFVFSGPSGDSLPYSGYELKLGPIPHIITYYLTVDYSIPVQKEESFPGRQIHLHYIPDLFHLELRPFIIFRDAYIDEI